MKNALLSIVVLVAVVVGGLYYASATGRPEFTRMAQTAFDRMQPPQPPSGASYSPADLERVPPVMRAYLQKAMPPSGPKTKWVNLELSGETRVSEDSSWDPYTARQRITGNPPQMIWAGEVDYLPLMPMMTLTTYYHGPGSIRSYLWGLANVFNNEGEVIQAYLMLRWLAEAVWHPDSLLPTEGLQWEEAEPPTQATKAARAVLENDGLKVSGRFVFPAGGGAPMFFLSDDLPFGRFAGQKWYCQYSDWRREGKRQIPFSLTQGTRQGIGDDVRLRVQVQSISYE